jgi:hypothetical protein
MRMLKFTLVLTLAALSSYAADPALLNLISPNSKVVAGAHVDRAITSPLGQFLLKQAQINNDGLQKFITATGFDPSNDLKEIVVASTDPGHKAGSGLAAMHGAFDVQKILANLKVKGVALTNYKDVPILAGSEPNAGWLGVLDSSTAVAGDAASVKDAIDRRGTKTVLDPQLTTLISTVSDKYDAWFASNVPISNFAGSAPGQQMNSMLKGDALAGIQQTAGGMIFGSTVQMMAELVARSAQDASSLVDIVKFLAGMAQSNTANQANTAILVNALSTLDIQATGATVTMSVSVPETDLEQIIESAPKHTPSVKKAELHRIRVN